MELNLHWKNDLAAPISIALLIKNAKGKFEVVKTEYTSQKASKVSIRGFESVPTLFAAVIRDSYDNFSDTIYAATPDKLLTPLFEERLNKTIFKKVVLQNDDNWDAWEGDYSYLFDDDMLTIVHTQGDKPRPSILTVDLGVNVKLSRFTVLSKTFSWNDSCLFPWESKKICGIWFQRLAGPRREFSQLDQIT